MKAISKRFIFYGIAFMLIIFLSFISHKSIANPPPPPQLIEISFTGSTSSPYFSPSEITVDVGKDYLLLINNPFNKPLVFQYDEELVDSIFTKYLQGSPNVSRYGVVISANSKVQWLFRAQSKGSFQFWAGSVGQVFETSRYGTIILELPESKIVPAKKTPKIKISKKLERI